jgi:hypothetical protein
MWKTPFVWLVHQFCSTENFAKLCYISFRFETGYYAEHVIPCNKQFFMRNDEIRYASITRNLHITEFRWKPYVHWGSRGQGQRMGKVGPLPPPSISLSFLTVRSKKDYNCIIKHVCI